MLRTELSLQSSEFEVYDVGNGSCVTFCLKEVRPLLAFAEHISVPVSIRFSTPGMLVLYLEFSSVCFIKLFMLCAVLL